MNELMNRPVRAILTLLMLGAASNVPGATPAIGVAVASGGFLLEHARVFGNTTLFDGSLVETSAGASELQLKGGAHVRLAAESRARVYQQRVVLEKGYTQLESSAGYSLEALSLRIAPAGPDTVTRVRLDGDRTVMVAALAGSVRVHNASGLLVAKVESGRAVSLDPQPASALTRVAGCMFRKANKFIVLDRTTNVMVELRGESLEALAGSLVEVSGNALHGTLPADGATQVVRVSSLKTAAEGGCASVARKYGTPADFRTAVVLPIAARTGGGRPVASVAVVGGVAVALRAEDLAATGLLSARTKASAGPAR